MRAVILAGGKGRRLEPYTINFPKPLVPVGDMPILEIVVRQLRRAGFDHITLAVGHLASLLQAYFGDGSKWGVRIDYSFEEKPLGTVAPLTLIDDLPETFLVMNGDILTTLHYDELIADHIHTGADLTIACHRCHAKIDLGVIEFDHRRQVVGYREKPTLPYDVSMGVYIFSRRVVDRLERDTYIDLPSLVHRLIEEKAVVKVFLGEHEWLDIGRPDDYGRASQRFNEIRDQFLPAEGAETVAAREKACV